MRPFKLEPIYSSFIFLSFVLIASLQTAHGRRDQPLFKPIKDALFYSGQFDATADNNVTYNGEKCAWRKVNEKDACPDPDVKYILYTPDEESEGGRKKEVVDMTQTDWLTRSNWNPNLENVMIVHGYAGGDDTLPIVVLRDAYLKNGSYNVFFVDWGKLSPPPCYPAAVHNMKAVARCSADLLTYLRNHGLKMERITCVGHSLGAHICGLMSQSILFRMHKIVGLDPAKPLIRSGSNNRLDDGDANSVQIIHTNAGFYGETGRMGHADFCVNGGRVQPFCENTANDNLCSHVWAICYMAESIFPKIARKAEPCSRRCTSGPRPNQRFGLPSIMGQLMPTTVYGTFCLETPDIPFCPKTPGDIGDKRCCIKTNNVDDERFNIL